MCAQPWIAVSGVRSSCESVIRNSSFSVLAASASPLRPPLALERLGEPLVHFAQPARLVVARLGQRLLRDPLGVHLAEQDDQPAGQQRGESEEEQRRGARLVAPLGQDLVPVERDSDDERRRRRAVKCADQLWAVGVQRPDERS